MQMSFDKPEEIEDTVKGKYLIFTIQNEEYALEIRVVDEILEMQPISEVPNLPAYIKGIINLRGDIIPVMDLRLRFYKEFREYDSRTAIIVVNIASTRLGLVADRANKVIFIEDSELIKPPEIKESDYNRFVTAICKTENKIKLVLDCEKILTDHERTELPSF